MLEPLGAGGMGQVYAAYDPELSRKVAVKLLLPQHAKGADAASARTRLIREAQAMAQLSHPQVVSVHDVGTFGQEVFIAMELVEGQTVGQWLRHEARPWREVLGVFREAGVGLAAAHRAGLIHRDFKPDNVLLTKEGHAKVTDFGLAKAMDRELEDSAAVTPERGVLIAELTEVGALVGTPAYIPPEQLKGGAPDIKGDMYSFSISLYEGLYGVRPFGGASRDELYSAIVSGRISEPPKDREVPAWLRRAVLRGLAVDPAARPATMDDFLDELARDPTRRRKQTIAAVGALSVIASASLALVAWGPSKASSPACAPPRQRLAGLWDDATRNALAVAFTAVPAPYAGKTWQQIARMLDGYASEWLGANVDTCKKSQVDHVEPREVHALRVLCLEREYLAWRSLVDVLRRPSPSIVERAITAVDGLAAPQRCSAQDVVIEPPPPRPTDPAAAARVDALAPTLAHAGALVQVGEYAAADEELAPVLRELESIGYQPALAEALIVQAKLAQQNSDTQALALAGRAAALALETSRLRSFAEACLVAAWSSISADLAQPDRTQQWIAFADSALNVLGDAGALRVRYYYVAAQALSYTGDKLEQADALARRGVELARKLGSDSDTAMDMFSMRAQIEAQLADPAARADALELARDLIERTERKFGALHPRLARRLKNGCQVTLFIGVLAEGEQWCSRILTFVGQSVDPSSVEAFDGLVHHASYLVLARRFDEARADLAKLDQLIAAQKLPDMPHKTWVELLRADVDYAEGNVASVQRRADWVVKAMAELTKDVDALRARTLQGWVLVQQGRHAQAVPVLEAAVRDWSGIGTFVGNRARTHFALARAIEGAGGDLQVARKHAETARAEYAGSTGLEHDLQAVDAWLAAHSPHAP